MQYWFFELFGSVAVCRGGQKRDDLVGKKAGALLALLALAPGRMRSREELIDLLWPEVDFEEARIRFRQQLTFLRKLLEPEGVAPGSVLIADRTQIGLAPEHTSDVAQFQQHLRLAAAAKDPTVQAAQLHAALELYTGEFAPGFYIDALLAERARLAQLAAGARERLATLEPALAQTPTAPAPPPLSPERTGRAHNQNRFFGRRDEQAHLRDLLERHRLVTLLGPGGTGKTRLVQELQAELPEAHFIPLSSLREGSRLLETLVGALGLPDSTDPPLQRLSAALHATPTLLLLDNLEQLVDTQGSEAIAELLETLPALRLLVTSRLRLNLPQECVCTLAPLPEGDAIALFLDRAQLAKSTFTLTPENEPTITELCQRLDGLPLAIELAAARVAVLSPQQILERLSRRFELLADRRRDRDERHTSLRAALDWGWSLLAPDLQQFFTSLCLFRGSFSLEAVEEVTAEPLALDYLQSLADASLILVEAERFWLLETLREYGLEKLDSDTRERLRRAHYAYYFDRVCAWRPLLNGAEFAVGMAHYKQEKENILIALDWALVAAPVAAVELCLKTAYFWHCSYGHRPALEYLNRALLVAQNNAIPDALRNQLDYAIGYAYTRLQEYASAKIFYQRIYEYYTKELAEQTQAGADSAVLHLIKQNLAGLLHNLGGIFFEQERNYEAAQRYLLEAKMLNESIGNDAWLARNIDCLGSLSYERALQSEDDRERSTLFETALDYVNEGMVFSERAQDKVYVCFLLEKKINLLQRMGEFDKARPLLLTTLTSACALDQYELIFGSLTLYYYQAIEERHWEVAAQFQGAIAGLVAKWDTGGEFSWAHSQRPTIDLAALLGMERYLLLHDAGSSASLEALQTLAARFHQPGLRQTQ